MKRFVIFTVCGVPGRLGWQVGWTHSAFYLWSHTGGRGLAVVTVCISDVKLCVHVHTNTTEVLRHSTRRMTHSFSKFCKTSHWKWFIWASFVPSYEKCTYGGKESKPGSWLCCLWSYTSFLYRISSVLLLTLSRKCSAQCSTLSISLHWGLGVSTDW